METALALSVQRFNKGSTALLDMMLQLELVVGPGLESEKQRRTRIELARRQELQQRQEQEGPTYGAGQF